MRIVIDSKQPEEFKTNIKQAYPDAVIMNLGENSGDLMITTDKGHLIAVEIKEIPDFVASVQDRRIFRQSQGLRAITPYAFLLIGGDFQYDAQWNLCGRNRNGYGPLGMTRDQVEGSLTRVMASGVIVRHAYRGYVEAVRLIIQWVERSDQGQITRPEPPRLSPFDEVDQRAVNWLTNFDGVGVVQAKNLIDFFGKRPVYKYLELATTPFHGPKPNGWTNHTVERCRLQLGLPKDVYLTDLHRPEWQEEI